MRRSTLWLAGAVAVAVVAVAAVALIDRADVDPAAVPLGPAADFPPQSVRSVEVTAALTDDAPLDGRSELVATVRAMERIPLFVVNQPPEPPLALLDRSPFLGCRVAQVTAEEAREYGHPDLDEGFRRGFLDPCHGSVYGLDGRLVAGPGERGLDRFPVTQQPDGTLTVDLTRFELGPAA